MSAEPWKLAQAEIYLLTIAAEEVWNEATFEDREARIGELYTALIEMLNGMSESLLSKLPEEERDRLFERARERMAHRSSGGMGYGFVQ